MELSVLLKQYLYLRSDNISSREEQRLRESLRLLAGALERVPTTEDLNDDAFNVFHHWLRRREWRGKPIKRNTRRAREETIMRLWRFAYRAGLTDCQPGRVLKTPREFPPPVAWTRDEVLCLYRTVLRFPFRPAHFPGTTICKRRYFSSLFYAAWDTALRLSDLLEFERDWIPPGGRLTMLQGKTREAVTVQFSPESMDLIDATMADQPKRARIWPRLWKHASYFSTYIKRIVGRAKSDYGIRAGTFRWIRRGSITDVEFQRAGAGTLHAGHRHRAVTERHYLDRAILSADIPRPRSLE